MISERGREVGLTGKAKSVADLCKGKVTLHKQLPGGFYPTSDDILVGRKSGALRKQPTELPWAHTEEFGQSLDTDVAAEILLDEPEDEAEPGRGETLGTSFPGAT